MTDEPAEFYFPEPNYLPIDRDFLEQYIPPMLEEGPYNEGIKYTYGQRMRSWFGHDQIEKVIAKIISEIDAVMKNSRTPLRAQNYKCRDCGRQLVESPRWRMISEETKGIIDRLLLEKLSLAGIARALDIWELWVQQYVNAKYQQVEQEIQVRPKPKRRLAVQMDELWSFVGNKGNKQWV